MNYLLDSGAVGGGGTRITSFPHCCKSLLSSPYKTG